MYVFKYAMLYALSPMLYALRSKPYALSPMLYALRPTLCALRSAPYAQFSAFISPSRMFFTILTDSVPVSLP